MAKLANMVSLNISWVLMVFMAFNTNPIWLRYDMIIVYVDPYESSKEQSDISYQSPAIAQDNRVRHGAKNRRIPAQKLTTSNYKKKNRKAFTSAKKKLGTAKSEINE